MKQQSAWQQKWEGGGQGRGSRGRQGGKGGEGSGPKTEKAGKIKGGRAGGGWGWEINAKNELEED